MNSILGVSVGAGAVRMARPAFDSAVQADGPFQFRSVPVGDAVPEEVAADAIVGVVEGDAPHSIGVAYRDERQAAGLQRALARRRITNYRLIPEYAAALHYMRASGRIEPAGLIALYDLGASGTSVRIVDCADGRVLAAERSSEVHGDRFDRLIRDEQLAKQTGPLDADALQELEIRCRQAKEQLSSSGAVCVPGPAGLVLLSRETLEAILAVPIERTARLTKRLIDGVSRDVDSVAVIGGGGRIPLVASTLTDWLGIPIVLPAEPELVIARGASLLAAPVSNPYRVGPTGPERTPTPFPPPPDTLPEAGTATSGAGVHEVPPGARPGPVHPLNGMRPANGSAHKSSTRYRLPQDIRDNGSTPCGAAPPAGNSSPESSHGLRLLGPVAVPPAELPPPPVRLVPSLSTDVPSPDSDSTDTDSIDTNNATGADHSGIIDGSLIDADRTEADRLEVDAGEAGVPDVRAAPSDPAEETALLAPVHGLPTPDYGYDGPYRDPDAEVPDTRTAAADAAETTALRPVPIDPSRPIPANGGSSGPVPLGSAGADEMTAVAPLQDNPAHHAPAHYDRGDAYSELDYPVSDYAAPDYPAADYPAADYPAADYAESDHSGADQLGADYAAADSPESEHPEWLAAPNPAVRKRTGRRKIHAATVVVGALAAVTAIGLAFGDNGNGNGSQDQTATAVTGVTDVTGGQGTTSGSTTSAGGGTSSSTAVTTTAAPLPPPPPPPPAPEPEPAPVYTEAPAYTPPPVYVPPAPAPAPPPPPVLEIPGLPPIVVPTIPPLQLPQFP